MSTTLIIVAVATTISFLWKLMAPQPKLKIPHVQFEGDNSMARYRAETKTLMGEGYEKYTRNGQAFSIRNAYNPKRPIAILPMKYLEEVKNAPQTGLSYPLFSERSFELKHIGGPIQTDEVVKMARVDLNRSLPNMIEPMQYECIAAFKDHMLACPEWTTMAPYQTLVQLFSRVFARVLVGPELGSSPQWQETALKYTMNVVRAAPGVRAKFHPRLRWLAKYRDEETKTVFQFRQQAAEILRPILEIRSQISKSEDRPIYDDAVQWLVDEYKSVGKKLTAEALAQDELLLTVASIHSSSATELSILFDMLDYPESMAEIRAEISEVQKKYPTWSRNALNSLKIMDSFMKESQRYHSFPQLTMQRVAVADWKFKDGLVIPAGTQVAFPNLEIALDDKIHPNASTFDPKRYLRKRDEIDSTKFHFASITDDSLHFGAGFHACPGRFLAQDAMKLIFIHLLTQYDIKYPEEGQKRPPSMPLDFNIMPNVMAPLLFKERASFSSERDQ